MMIPVTLTKVERGKHSERSLTSRIHKLKTRKCDVSRRLLSVAMVSLSTSHTFKYFLCYITLKKNKQTNKQDVS